MSDAEKISTEERLTLALLQARAENAKLQLEKFNTILADASFKIFSAHNLRVGVDSVDLESGVITRQKQEGSEEPKV